MNFSPEPGEREQAALDAIAAVYNTTDIDGLERDAAEWARLHGEAESLEEAEADARYARAVLLRARRHDAEQRRAGRRPIPRQARRRRPRRSPPGGRPRGRRTRRASRAGPSSDEGPSPPPPLGGSR